MVLLDLPVELLSDVFKRTLPSLDYSGVRDGRRALKDLESLAIRQKAVRQLSLVSKRVEAVLSPQRRHVVVQDLARFVSNLSRNDRRWIATEHLYIRDPLTRRSGAAICCSAEADMISKIEHDAACRSDLDGAVLFPELSTIRTFQTPIPPFCFHDRRAFMLDSALEALGAHSTVTFSRADDYPQDRSSWPHDRRLVPPTYALELHALPASTVKAARDMITLLMDLSGSRILHEVRINTHGLFYMQAGQTMRSAVPPTRFVCSGQSSGGGRSPHVYMEGTVNVVEKWTKETDVGRSSAIMGTDSVPAHLERSVATFGDSLRQDHPKGLSKGTVIELHLGSQSNPQGRSVGRFVTDPEGQNGWRLIFADRPHVSDDS